MFHEVVVLGIAQDGGFPHFGCRKYCCAQYCRQDIQSNKRHAACVALLIGSVGHACKVWLFDATPDMREQWGMLDDLMRERGCTELSLEGVFLTHAHCGHYVGLWQLGRESAGCSNVPVWCAPRMAGFLRNNAPWSQLVTLKNINIHELVPEEGDLYRTVELREGVFVEAFGVRHRGEFSETVGYVACVKGGKKCMFLPDIDRWEPWIGKEKGQQDPGIPRIAELVKEVDVAYLDATFFDNKELGRDMSEIPHPL
eukprot:CAMPEP_0201534540 /NCGR_PEP_ID=MMETSP0161_2-20130828/56567_1 /ASSEMBLY_ACC=CAM_ASM_000251 /TAXON_ID=180227 /ORGANISM="Neoparamoeba aestuarina, Strain SoJaBio B1-5/56/2" /LENGTH=254 /DNA_ID=CAMNT_0047939223 /DNA_START=89 /DNA_END=850 /DNA_ORIENTATION=-